MKKAVFWSSKALLLLFVLGGVFIGAVYLFFTDPTFQSVPFNSRQWISGDQGVRGQMYEDLAKGPVLNKKSEQEIVAVLGPPDYRSIGSQSSSLYPEYLHLVYKLDRSKRLGSTVLGEYLHILIDPATGKTAKHYTAD